MTKRDDIVMGKPENDGYQKVAKGERCPKCGEPGFRKVRTFGLLVETVIVHSTAGSGYGGCIIEEKLVRP